MDPDPTSEPPGQAKTTRRRLQRLLRAGRRPRIHEHAAETGDRHGIADHDAGRGPQAAPVQPASVHVEAAVARRTEEPAAERIYRAHQLVAVPAEWQIPDDEIDSDAALDEHLDLTDRYLRAYAIEIEYRAQQAGLNVSTQVRAFDQLDHFWTSTERPEVMIQRLLTIQLQITRDGVRGLDADGQPTDDLPERPDRDPQHQELIDLLHGTDRRHQQEAIARYSAERTGQELDQLDSSVSPTLRTTTTAPP